MSGKIETISLKSISLFILTAIFLALLIFSPCHADTYLWIGGTGSWDNPSNWNPTGVPSKNVDQAFLTQSDGINRTVSFSNPNDDFNVGYIRVDATGSGRMTLSQSQGNLYSDMDVGYYGKGIVNQSGGLHYGSGGLQLGYKSTGIGIYNLSNGVLRITGSEVIGGSGIGIFNQNGGSHSTDSRFVLGSLKGSIGTYNLLSGSLDVGPNNEAIGGSGTGIFNQSGGTNRGMGWISLGGGYDSGDGKGTYNLSGGSLSFRDEYIGSSGTGVFNQTGGTNTVQTITIAENPGSSGKYSLSGGTLTASNIVNNDRFNYSGGNLNLGTLTNNGVTSLSGTGTRTINGDIVNNGTFKTTLTTASYTGTFTNYGGYISTASAQYFNNLVISQSGYLSDRFASSWYINGNFVNSSLRNIDWNTSYSYLNFLTGVNSKHDMYLTGADHGAMLSGYNNNFSWGILNLNGSQLNLYDGNNAPGASLYLGRISGLDIDGRLIKNIYGDGFNIYYLAELNSPLGGLTYDLMNGGHLIPVSTPEPTTILLLGLGLIGLAGVRRKFKE